MPVRGGCAWFHWHQPLALTAVLFVLYVNSGDPVYGTPYFAGLYTTYALCAWCWVLAILGLAAQRLTFATPLLAYANEAVLPFYVMHQTVLLTVGYVVVRWSIPDLAKWALIGGVSLAVCLGLYEFLIRRHNVLRFLFGMKPLVLKPTAQPSELFPLGKGSAG